MNFLVLMLSHLIVNRPIIFLVMASHHIVMFVVKHVIPANAQPVRDQIFFDAVMRDERCSG